MAVVAVNTNQTLAMHCTFDFTFIEMSTQVFLIRLNETIIAMKSQSDKVLMLSFYTNNTEINLNVIKQGVNDTIYLSIHYYVKQGITPPPPPEPEPEEEPFIPPFTGMSFEQVLFMSIMGLPLFCGAIPWSIKSVVRWKEHRTKSRAMATATDRYRSPQNEEVKRQEH